MEDWGEEGYVEKMLDPATMLERLKEQGSYSFIFSVYNAAGEIRTKKCTFRPSICGLEGSASSGRM